MAEHHGGDDVHNVGKLMVDLSVTTNALGPVPEGLAAVRACVAEELPVCSGEEDEVTCMACGSIEHYPKRSDMDLRNRVANFLADDPAVDTASRGFGGSVGAGDYEQRLMLGAGASELIDLLGRCAPPGGYIIDPHVRVQYREYQRAAKNAGRALTSLEEARMVAIVNPNNPTGDFQEREAIEKYIEKAQPGTWVLVDESMLFWAGPNWRDRGLTGRRGSEFIARMAAKGVMVWIVHSWTKIFSCTGLRVGSILAPTPELRAQLESKQVPWSLSAFAQAYLHATLEPAACEKYLSDTWVYTKKWRKYSIDKLASLYPRWTFHGHDFNSWIWIDTHNEASAKAFYDQAFKAGCPIRFGGTGYGLPTCVRIAVRKPSEFNQMFDNLPDSIWRQGRPSQVEYEDYDTTACVYDATRVAVGLPALLEQLATCKAASVLDLGCGTGTYLVPMAAQVQQVHGLDLSASMLKQCGAKVAERKLRNVKLQLGSLLEPLPFGDASFDAVVINQVLHHVDTAGAFDGSALAVQEAHRVLKPGGLLWASYSDPQQTLKGYWYNKLIPRAAQEFAKRQVPTAHLEGLLAASGFHAVRSVVDHEPQQGKAYFQVTGPLNVEFRQGDSQWTMATPEEVAAAEATIEHAIKNHKLGALFDEFDAGRHEVGQTTWTYGFK